MPRFCIQCSQAVVVATRTQFWAMRQAEAVRQNRQFQPQLPSTLAHILVVVTTSSSVSRRRSTTAETPWKRRD
jgi:hypothetical protein